MREPQVLCYANWWTFKTRLFRKATNTRSESSSSQRDEQGGLQNSATVTVRNGPVPQLRGPSTRHPALNQIHHRLCSLAGDRCTPIPQSRNSSTNPIECPLQFNFPRRSVSPICNSHCPRSEPGSNKPQVLRAPRRALRDLWLYRSINLRRIFWRAMSLGSAILEKIMCKNWWIKLKW